MRRIIMGIIGMSLVLVAALAYARPWDGSMSSEGLTTEQKQFFEATRELRKEMHDKRFQLMENYRSGGEQAKIDALETEIGAIQSKIRAKADELGFSGGPGNCAKGKPNCRMSSASGCDNGPCGNQQANAGCGKRGRCWQQ